MHSNMASVVAQVQTSKQFCLSPPHMQYSVPPSLPPLHLSHLSISPLLHLSTANSFLTTALETAVYHPVYSFFSPNSFTESLVWYRVSGLWNTINTRTLLRFASDILFLTRVRAKLWLGRASCNRIRANYRLPHSSPLSIATTQRDSRHDHSSCSLWARLQPFALLLPGWWAVAAAACCDQARRLRTSPTQ